MELWRALALAWMAAAVLAGQTGAGILAGTVSDPAKGMIGRARLSAKDAQSEQVFHSTANPAGGYIFPSLPVGTYELTVTMPGYNRFVQSGLKIVAGETLRVDVFLQAGLMSESLMSTLDEPMITTAGAEISTILTEEQVDALPLVRTQMRSPLDFALLVTGASAAAGEQMAPSLRVNGSPAGTFRVLLDGQDVTSAVSPGRTLEQAPTLSALSELRLQTSNFAAEFGQVSGGLFNLRSRSGGNQPHGSIGSFFRHEILNAGRPFSGGEGGSHVRPRSRDYDFNANFGGPLFLPSAYDGRDRTFFFVNLEYFRVRGTTAGSYTTVPTEAYRRGDFSGALSGVALGTDILGRPIPENIVYDPASNRLAAGRLVRDPFPSNVIPEARLDAVALALQSYIPLPDPWRVAADGTPLAVNNLEVRARRRQERAAPSVRFDHLLGAGGRVSFYASMYRFWGVTGEDAMPYPISSAVGRDLRAWTMKLTGEYTITPSILARVGFGYVRWVNREHSDLGGESFRSGEIWQLAGSAGGLIDGMPHIAIGLGSANRGGLAASLGAGGRRDQYADKPGVNANLTFESGDHTYRVGGEVRQDIWAVTDEQGTRGTWDFRAAQTALPYLQTENAGGGSAGFAYASFLLGRAEKASVGTVRNPRYVKTTLGVFAQDTWKATSRLTLDYGIRWDSQPAPLETNYHTAMFGPNVVNPSAGGRLGGMVYEGFGPGRCNCTFTKTYLFAFGPRLGLAWQLTPNTVLRGGWGVSYGNPNNYNDLNGNVGYGWNSADFSSVSFGEPGATLSSGLVYDAAELTRFRLDPGLRPSPGQINSPTFYLDQNAGRPPRIVQWNVSLQHGLTRNILAEIAYLGNRSVWTQANSLLDLNALTPAAIEAAGLSLSNAGDRDLLLSPLNSELAGARGFSTPPYSGFPATLTVAQSLRPYPQFGDIPVRWAPLGRTWYDALQAKFTRRLAGGLSGTAAFTWQKELTHGVCDQSGSFVGINDVFNLANQKTLLPQSRPLVTVITLSYQVPRVGPHWLIRTAIGGWTISGFFRYRSGALIQAPMARNNLEKLLFRGTYATRVEGQPLYLTAPDGKIDPNRQFVLNPAAWADPNPGQWGQSAVYFSDYRGRRTPEENMSAGRVIHIREGVNLEVRVDFYNVLNRLVLPLPSSTNALAPQLKDSTGRPVSGFGYIDTTGGVTGTREGQFMARFRF